VEIFLSRRSHRLHGGCEQRPCNPIGHGACLEHGLRLCRESTASNDTMQANFKDIGVGLGAQGWVRRQGEDWIVLTKSATNVGSLIALP